MSQRSHTASSRYPRFLALGLLAVAFLLSLLPVFHWNLGTPLRAMAYLVGVPLLITLGIIAVYLTDKKSADRKNVSGSAK